MNDCAWCGEPLGKQEKRTPDGITHGLCKKCLKKVLGLGGVYIFSSAQRFAQAETLWDKDRSDKNLRWFLKRESGILLRRVLKAWWQIRFGSRQS